MSDDVEQAYKATSAEDDKADKLAYDLKTREVKDEIAQHIDSVSDQFHWSLVTMALLELGIERHLKVCQTEKSATQLALGVIQKVLRNQQASLQ